MNKYPIEVGAIVVSRMGRDAGRRFLVIQEVDADFVLLTDGRLRTMDRPKMKRRKHLSTTGIVVEALRDRLLQGGTVENHEIRSWLKREEKQACPSPM